MSGSGARVVDIGTPPSGFEDWTTTVVRIHNFSDLPTTKDERVFVHLNLHVLTIIGDYIFILEAIIDQNTDMFSLIFCICLLMKVLL